MEVILPIAPDNYVGISVVGNWMSSIHNSIMIEQFFKLIKLRLISQKFNNGLISEFFEISYMTIHIKIKTIFQFHMVVHPKWRNNLDPELSVGLMFVPSRDQAGGT